MDRSNKALTLKYTKSYGRILLYPNCKISVIIIQLTKKKAFTKDDAQLLKKLGYELNFVYENDLNKGEDNV